MNRMFVKPLAAVAGVFALVAVTAASVSAAPTVPFAAGFAGSIHVTSADPSGNPLTAAYGGPGTMATAGNVASATMQGVITVQGPAPSCGAAGGFTAQHQDTLTDADGSLTVQVNEVACAVAPGSYQCTGTFSVIGGTGRFAGAGGSGAFNGRVSFNPDGSGTFQAAYAGRIALAK